MITICRRDRCVSIFLQPFTHKENAICKEPARKKLRLVSSASDEQEKVFQAGMKITGALQEEVYHFLYSSI